MSQKKYVTLSKLQTFLENLSSRFAVLSHKHTVSDFTDYNVDSSLSSTSTNPVQNKVIDAEFEAISVAMNALDLAIDGKANASHNHAISEVTNLQTSLDAKVPTSRTINGKALSSNITLSASDVGAAASSHNHDDLYYTESEIDAKLQSKSNANHNHDSKYDAKGSASAVQGNLDLLSDALDSHTGDSNIHVTSANKTNWNAAYTHSQAAHARTDATKVADSTTNGNILINGTETNVYSHPNSGVTAGVYKSVTVNAQGHITGGSNPTTLAGYGITDAESKGSAASALTSAKEYTDTKTSGLASTTVVDNKISSHNTSTSAHNDIRTLINELTTKLNNFLDVDDATTDQLSEVITLINNNKGTLESLTTSKVNVADIVNNLTTNNASKVLSAAQGVAIKNLIDALQEDLDSHSHAISDVSGLQSALDGKAAASHGAHVSYSTTAPVMDGTASVGSASTVARSDHKHPTDTSRASKSEFDTHNSDTTKHITSAERTNWNAAKTHADSAHAPSNAEKNQNAFSNIKVGSTTIAADTVTDTLELVGSNVTITPDATNDKVTIEVSSGSTSVAGIVKLTDSTSSTSTTTAATPKSVKSAYDLANTAKTNAATAQTKADSAYTLASGKADSLSDLGVTVSDTELNYMDGAIRNIQSQLDERRTHWIERGSGVILSSRSVSNNATLSGLTNVTPPDCIVVTFDNVEYKCVMWTNSFGENCYGDSRIAEVTDMTNPENTPFYINACADDGADFSLVWNWYVVFNSNISSTSHTIKINEAEYHVISENFIPNTIARASAVSKVQIITWEAND